jgi:hypothetical protein
MQAKARQELVPQSAKDGVAVAEKNRSGAGHYDPEEEKSSHGTRLLDTAQELQAPQAPHTRGSSRAAGPHRAAVDPEHPNGIWSWSPEGVKPGSRLSPQTELASLCLFVRCWTLPLPAR